MEKEKGGVRVWDGRLRGTKAKAYLVRPNPKEVLPTDTPPPKEPSTRKEALASESKKEWVKAMDEEMKAMRDYGVWELVELPEGRKLVGVKWVFRVKLKEDGTVERFKARLTAKG